MRERLRGIATGLGAALAVSLPAELVAQILDTVGDGALPAAVTVPLSLVVLAGAVVGGAVVGHRQPGRHRVDAALVGLVGIGLIVALGATRRGTSGDDTSALVVAALLSGGAALGTIGGALGARRAGRTRR